jgi:hypothetical protein
METAVPEKHAGTFRRSKLWRSRTVSLDIATNEMLMELSEGYPSSWMRRIIAIEYGKKLAAGEREQK